ncbi:MAG: hypothetical protein OXC18_19060 [Desulfurellaceae bacterium]|nr:hypothetical protein [Desulfurellaceae bacterium]
MKRESGSKNFPIWLIGDSNPESWADVLNYPLDPRHPARHNIWTPILDGIQEQVFLADGRRVATDQLYARNAVQDKGERPPGTEIVWQPGLLKEVHNFASLLTLHTPKLVFTFGAFAFEFARRSLKENPEEKTKGWTTERLGQEFRQRVRDFDPEGINIFPLLHISIARRWFLQSHNYFTGREGGNYFDYVAKEIAPLLLEHKLSLPIWAQQTKVVDSKTGKTISAEAVDPKTGETLIVEIEDGKLAQLNDEFRSQEIPKRKLNRMIDNLAIPADAKAFVASLMDKTLRVGSIVLKVGKWIVEIMVDIVNQFPKTTASLVLGVIVFHLVNSITLLGSFLGMPLVSILVLFGLKEDFMDWWRNPAIDRKIREAIRPFEVLKGAS